LRELALVFLKLGAIGFGGPAAHIDLMEEEVVARRRWLTREHFLDLLGATNLIPGPNSTEMAIHVGYLRRRWAGLMVAGACFILPAVVVTSALAWAYVQFGTLPAAAPLLFGIKPVVLAIILGAATFIGYLLAGWPGAAVATMAIFFPSFVFVSILGPLLPRLRRWRWASSFLDAVNASSVALMAAVTLKLVPATLVSWPAVLIAVAAAAASLWGRVNAAWLVLGGALVGWLFFVIQS
jgi:chromate transport protein ChrA